MRPESKTFFLLVAMRELLIYALILFFLVIRLVLAAQTGLAPDEAYYWYWSQHLDLSYYDHPPLVAYVMAFSTWLGGKQELFVRLGGFVLALGALFLMILTTRVLFPQNPPPAAEIFFLFGSSLLFAAASIVQTPDTPLIFFWAAALYTAALIVTRANPYFWYLLGILFGLGLLSKYSMVLFPVCLVLFLLVSAAQRFWLVRKEPYLALCLSLLVFSPVLIWNWRHDWVSFGYQITQGFSPKSLNVLWKFLEYVGGQAAVITPLLFAGFCWYSFLALRSKPGMDFTSYVFLLCFSWPVLVFFGISSLMGKIAEANWPAPAYLAGFLLLWAYYHGYGRQYKGHRYFMASALGLALISSVLVHLHLFHPFLPIAPRLDPTHQFHGWSGLGREIDRIIKADPHPAGHFFLADRGTTLAEAIFYTPGNYLGFDPHIPQRYLFLKDPATLKNKNAVIILHNASDAALANFQKYFEKMEKAGQYTPTFRGEPLDELAVSLYLGRQYLPGENREATK